MGRNLLKISNWLPAGKPRFDFVPRFDAWLPMLPAQVDFLFTALGRKVDQAGCDVFDDRACSLDHMHQLIQPVKSLRDPAQGGIPTVSSRPFDRWPKFRLIGLDILVNVNDLIHPETDLFHHRVCLFQVEVFGDELENVIRFS